MDDTSKTIRMIDHLQTLLETNFLAYERHNVYCVLSRCECDITTPYALEIIDLIDSANNHLILTASTLERLLTFVPLNLSVFELVPYVDRSEENKQFVQEFMANATKEKETCPLPGI